LKKGGRLEKYYPLYEAMYTFNFSPTTVTQRGSHVRDSLDTKRYMILVVIALLPCILFGIYNTGYQTQMAGSLPLNMVAVWWRGLLTVLPLFIVTFAVGGLWEAVFAMVRKHEINEGFLVTGMLFPLILPPTIPLWQVAIGISFGVVLGKEVFGGTGKNFLNPALTARAFLFFSYPAYMSGDAVWTMVTVAKERILDGFSGATPLAIAFVTEAPNSAVQAIVNSGFTPARLFWGNYSGSVGETSVLACLIGAAFLIIVGIGSWRIMAACVVGTVAMAGLFNVMAGPDSIPFFSMGPIWHMLIGGFAFGTVFMATDPVSAPSMNASKWVYGIMIGVLTVIIRCANPAYPEGIMLAILLMNVFAPLIDHMVIQRQLNKRIPNVI